MLQRKIREVVGSLKTLKNAQDNPYAGAGGVARDLETDCMVKLALLFPYLPEGEFPDEIVVEMSLAGIGIEATDGDFSRICLKASDGILVDLDCRTGALSRRETREQFMARTRNAVVYK